MKSLKTCLVLFFGSFLISNTCIQKENPLDRKKPAVIFAPPKIPGNKSLEECIAARRSIRRYEDKKLTRNELGQLCWAAQGITGKERPLRTAPSAGALYPLEIYLVALDGLYHYIPQDHKLKVLRSDDLRNALSDACMGQQPIKEASATLVITAVYQRTARKYGEKRSWQYIDIEVGHAAQNVALQAVALGLGTVDIGGYDDKRVKEALSLPKEHEPRLLIPIGHPKSE